MLNEATGQKDMDFDQEVKTMQVDAVLSGMPFTTIGGILVSASVAYIVYDYQGTCGLWWLATVTTAYVLRILLAYFASRRVNRKPDTELTMLSTGGLVLGLLWAIIPLTLSGNLHDVNTGYVLFSMAGNCAGSMIQSSAYSRIVRMFVLPQMTSAVVVMVSTGEIIPSLIGVMLFFHSGLILKGAKAGEVQFLYSRRTTLKATTLAKTLGSAHEEILEKNQSLEIIANKDALTGLANRTLYNRILGDIAHHWEQDGTGEPTSLVILDIDNFKQINDNFGHSYGDSVLVEFATRLVAITKDARLVARLGGDEYAVIFCGPDSSHRAQKFGTDVLADLMRPLILEERTAVISTSMGIATFPGECEAIDRLYSSTDVALYEAKTGGGRRLQVYDGVLKERLKRNVLIRQSLERALDTGEVRAYFQPQIDLRHGTVSGMEALIRWHHPVIGPVAPPEIVAAAHDLHISDKLTSFMTRAACHLIDDLDGIGLNDVTVAVNISPREFASYRPPDLLAKVLQDHNIERHRLEIEITEESLLDLRYTHPDLKLLHELGFKLAVDDFGMGHSSLAHLINLHVDRLKIDKSFVKNITSTPQNQALVSTLLRMSKALNISIVVEGVETEDDAETLRLLGARIAQGYCFAYPMPQAAVLQWLLARGYGASISDKAADRTFG